MNMKLEGRSPFEACGFGGRSPAVSVRFWVEASRFYPELSREQGPLREGAKPFTGRPIVALPQIFTPGPGEPLMPGCKTYQGFCPWAR